MGSNDLRLSSGQLRLAALLAAKGRQRVAPLSLSQRRLWFLSQMVPDSPFYNMPGAVHLRGRLNVIALEQSVQEVVRRHDTLRTTFVVRNGEPEQKVHETGRVALRIVDLSAIPETERDALALRLQQQETSRTFDLANGPILRLALLRLAADEYVLLMTIHHLISDGWSQEVLLRELQTLQADFIKGATSSLNDLTIQYADYTGWQHKWVTSDAYYKQLAYWRRQLEDIETLQIPADRPRPRLQTFRGATAQGTVENETVHRARDLARTEQATLFMVLLAAFVSLLHRYTGQRRIAVGTPTANRSHSETAQLVGLFVNMLVLNVTVESGMTFRETLRRVRQVCLGAYENEEFPFEKLVEELQPDRDLSQNPFFQVALVQLTPLALEDSVGGAAQKTISVFSGATKFDLQLNVQEDHSKLDLIAEYSMDLFNAATVSRMLAHYGSILRSAVDDPDTPIARLPFLGEQEVRQIVWEWNQTNVEYDRHGCIHSLIEAQVSSTPDAIAVIDGPEMHTYAEMDRAANQLAHYLRRVGVKRGSMVGILLQRSAEMVTSLLGVLKAGGMYVPLDTSYPAARVAEILAVLSIEHLIVHSAKLPAVASMAQQLPSLNYLVVPDRANTRDWGDQLTAHIIGSDDLRAEPASRPVNSSESDDPAYIIFTSGSTGTPKGVIVCHRPVMNLIDWVRREFGVSECDEALFITSLSFDLSVYDIFGLLAVGGRVRVASSDDLQNPRKLANLLLEGGVTFWDSAPAALQQLTHFLPEEPRSDSALRLVFLSGDWIPVALPDRIRGVCPAAEIVALGGATEATVWSNSYRIREVDPSWTSIPYGRPIQNARYYILDQEFAPAPPGVTGDLYIGGECLFTGYAGDPVLTAEKLYPDPFTPSLGGRMYRSGDRARFWTDGTIEFLGRADYQVKIRGFRVEPGEIQVRLNQLEGVRQSAVIALKSGDGTNQLVAYYVSEPGEPISSETIRAKLQLLLPEYMIPSSIVCVSEIPLTSNGKVDRSVLAELSYTDGDGQTEFASPTTQVEQILAAIWSELLKLDRVSVTGNFFQLGGHSLLATKMIARIAETFQVEFPLRKIFEFPAIAGLAIEIEQAIQRDILAMSDAEVQRAMMI